MRVVVFGGSGWVGRALVPRLSREFEVLAPTRASVDVSRPGVVAEFVARERPLAIVNLAAAQASAPKESMVRVNGAGAGCVAFAASDVGARLVHVSTDMVLDGRRAPYADGAPAAPITTYGETKADGEEAVRRAHPAAAIVRTSLVYDPASVDRATESFARRLAAGAPCPLYSDEIRSPIARGALCDALAELVRNGFSGPLNVAGSAPLSRHEFGLRLLRHFRVPGLDRVRPALAADLAEPRPLDLTLDVSRATALLSSPLRSVADELAAAERRLDRGGT